MSDASPEGSPPVDRWDRVFRALSRQPRRRVLCALLDESPAGWVALPDAAMTPAYRDREEELRVLLVHHHLPALADADYVRWRRAPFEACRGPAFDEVEAVLDAILSRTDDLPDRLVGGCRLPEGGRRLNG